MPEKPPSSKDKPEIKKKGKPSEKSRAWAYSRVKRDKETFHRIRLF